MKLSTIDIILFVIIFFIIIFFIYKKIYSNYWVYASVFHFYDLKYYFLPSGTTINKERTAKNMFCDFKNIKTYDSSEIDNDLLQKIVLFLNHHFYQESELTEDFFKLLFLNFSNYNYLSLYYDEDEIIGSMVNVEMNMKINVGNCENIKIYYADQLCVHAKHRKKGIASKLIETHIHNFESLSNKTSVSIYENEYSPFSIVKQSCVYDLYKYEMVFENKKDEDIFIIEKCNEKNIFFLYDFLNKNSSRFDVFILPELDYLIELIKKDYILIYYTKNDKNNITNVFFYKKGIRKLLNVENKYIILLSSINYSGSSESFLNSFSKSLIDIHSFYELKGIVIRNLTDNHIIIENDKKLNSLSIIKKSELIYSFIFRNIIVKYVKPKHFFIFPF